jgi:hypothetical protein
MPQGLFLFFKGEVMDQHYFARLSKINVSQHLEKKGAFSYLSWPYAVEQLRLADPKSTWEVKRFNNLPYLRTDLGFFVEVAVTVEGITLSQIHPVLDSKNRPIEMPSAFDINTSIQRCLVKAIALHGLGLYVYAGEDLPEAEPKQNAAGKITDEQLAKLRTLLADSQTTLQRFLAFFRIDSLPDLPSTEFDRAIQTLERAKRRAA